MSQIFNKMRIDVRQDIVDIITAKQNDSNSRFLDVFLYDGATPIDLTGEEVRIYMRKPDGTEIFNNGTITDAVNGRCEFELTSQALGAVGVLQCEISIWQDNTEILTTQTFHVFVTESLRSDGSVESSNEYGALVVLFQNLYESMDLMQDMVANFGTPSGSVDASTFWQMLEELYAVNSEALANASVSEVLNRIGTSDSTVFAELSGLESTSQEILSKVWGSVSALISPPVSATIIKGSSIRNGTVIDASGKGYVDVYAYDYNANEIIIVTIDGVDCEIAKPIYGIDRSAIWFPRLYFNESIKVVCGDVSMGCAVYFV